MSEQVSVTVYGIDELSAKAKEYAIGHIRESIENCEELSWRFEQELETLGYPIDQIEWSLGCCQGDGMAFYGKIPDIHKIALVIGMTEEEAESLKDYSLTIMKNSFGHHYSHWNTMTLNEDDVDNSQFYQTDENGDCVAMTEGGSDYILNPTYSAFRDLLIAHIKSTSKRLEALGYEIIETNESDERCIEIAHETEMRFTESGREWT